VLAPCALENVITRRNAGNIRARIIAEGANGPTTAFADSILEEKGVFVIPDILANAGGVTVSYFEWVQNREGYYWREDTVNERLTDVMIRAFSTVLQYSRRHHVNMRTAAYMLSI
jgi:glutamate dehydrogenase (NAD(P)+)